MCVGWQGTSLAVNSNVTDGNEFSEVGAGRATKPLPPYSTGLRDTPLQKCNFGDAFVYLVIFRLERAPIRTPLTSPNSSTAGADVRLSDTSHEA